MAWCQRIRRRIRPSLIPRNLWHTLYLPSQQCHRRKSFLPSTPFSKLTEDQTLVAQGYNMFRVPFAMERLAATGVASTFSAAYLANLTASVNYMTSKGAYAILDPHNFGRYNGAIITDVAAFGTFWTNLANAFKTNSKVVCTPSKPIFFSREKKTANLYVHVTGL